MPPTFPQIGEAGNFDAMAFSSGSRPVLLFFVDPLRKDSENAMMLDLAEELFKEYGARVDFRWLVWSRSARICQEQGVLEAPAIIIFSKGRELARFHCSDSERGIRYNLGTALDPNSLEGSSLHGLQCLREVVPLI